MPLVLMLATLPDRRDFGKDWLLERKFDGDSRPIPRGTHWTRPELAAQIGFAEWTNDGRLRQPRFLGLRDDKRPGEVVREQAR